jgi:hypothetical protein
VTEAFDAPAWLAPAELPAALVSPQGIEWLRWSSAGYATRPTDSPASTPYPARIIGDVEMAQSAVDALGLGGQVAVTAGDIRLADGDGALADLDRYGTADGRAIRILTLPVRDNTASDFGAAYAEAHTAFAGLVRGVYREAGMVGRLALADLAERLNTPLQPARYGGTGGLDGTAELAGRPKPVALGRVFNAEPVYLGDLDLGDGAKPSYQFHWRGIEAVDAVRMRGVAQTLVGTAPAIGQVRAWPQFGVVQLGAAADGSIRGDLRGDNVGGYVGTEAGVLRRLLSSLSPALGDGQLDATAFAFADVDLPGEVGLYLREPALSAAEAVRQLCAGSGSVVAGSRAGLVRIFDPIAAGGAEQQFSLDATMLLDLEPLPLPAVLRPLPMAAALTWRPNAAPITDAAAGVAAAIREPLTTATSGPERVLATGNQTRQAVQRDFGLASRYWAKADAAARATAWAKFLDAGPRLYGAITDRYLGEIEAGDVGRLSYPAWGLESGARVTVLAWRERQAARRLNLTLVTLPES